MTAVLRDFMCTCNDAARAKAEACYARVIEEVVQGGEPEDFLTGVVYALDWGLDGSEVGGSNGRFTANIDGIYCDQWSVVSVVVRRADETSGGYVEHARVFVQCDRVEHGIARAYELAVEATR